MSGLFSFLCFLCVSTFFNFAMVQSAPIPIASATPSNPATLMEVAFGVNGLASADLKPWYLKASYTTYDEHGQLNHTGVFEEWWAAPNKYKRRYASKDFSLTEYVTDTGTYRVGDTDYVPFPLTLLPERLLAPMPSAKDYEQSILLRRKQSFGSADLSCVLLARKMPDLETAPTGLFPSYCFEINKPVLRWSGSLGQYNTLYNQIGSFQEKYVAQDISIIEGADLKILTAHLEMLNGLHNASDADFQPPTDAIKVPAGKSVEIGAGIMQGSNVKKVAPIYPAEAKQKRIEGKVIIQAEIGEDGHIHGMKILEAPHPLLAIVALMAVKQWEYKPYLINGRPVRVVTQITAIFRLGS
jgi:TonB family protein